MQLRPPILATTASNTMELTLEKSAVDAQKPSQIDMLLSPVESSPTDLPDSPSLNSGSTISPDTIEETPDYIFTVPDYQPRRRWFGGKKKPSTPATTIIFQLTTPPWFPSLPVVLRAAITRLRTSADLSLCAI